MNIQFDTATNWMHCHESLNVILWGQITDISGTNAVQTLCKKTKEKTWDFFDSHNR